MIRKRDEDAGNTAEIKTDPPTNRQRGAVGGENIVQRLETTHEKRKAVTAKRLLPTREMRPMHDVDWHCVSLQVSSPCSEHRRRHDLTARRRARQMFEMVGRKHGDDCWYTVDLEAQARVSIIIHGLSAGSPGGQGRRLQGRAAGFARTQWG